jgi:hypothetical protein
MKRAARHAVIWIWVLAVLLIGGIGASSLTAIRVALGLAALGCAVLAVRALHRGRTGWVVGCGLAAAVLLCGVVFPRPTQPVWELLLELLDDL